VCLSGAEPWRSPGVLAARAYAEVTLTLPSYRDRTAMWERALPELSTGTAEDLAARYKMSDEELRAIAALARTDALFGAHGVNGHSGAHNGSARNASVERAVTALTCGPVAGFAHAITPRRRPEDLVLPPDEHRMVLELAAAYHAWPRVAEDWGFAARGGGGGIKALFTGEPGTGKTLAAEVVAGMLGLTLLKIDLSQVVSKWVGETEKNLDTVFRQAEDSQALLFFDEADALFGKRGEVKHGMDRYANLEVGFLLQRLEQSDALVILASNLKENLDKAFTRRFHHIIHFPCPESAERERIWRLAFPPEAPLGSGVDFAILSNLDMTGASIAGAARAAAFLAADSRCTEISMTHIIQGVGRQYQRDRRLLRPEQLGPHATISVGALHGR
jgi:ATPase family associated with various cellular activities (AAA)